MMELVFFTLVSFLAFLLGYFKGSFDEEERQRKMRKKIYNIKGE